MMDIGKDLQNAYEEGYKQGYEQGEKDALYMAIEALSEKTSTIQEKHQLSEETPTNTPTKSTNISTNPSADRPRGEWIPVSEKPKDEKRTSLVQLDGGGMCSCRSTNVNPIWTDITTEWHWNIFDTPQYSKVVAWMDLEPYKGGEEE